MNIEVRSDEELISRRLCDEEAKEGDSGEHILQGIVDLLYFVSEVSPQEKTACQTVHCNDVDPDLRQHCHIVIVVVAV